MSTPDLQLQTLFVLDSDGRIVSTREPGANRGPCFALIRSAVSCAWAVRADVPPDVAGELADLARHEPPAADLSAAPVAADRYRSLLQRRVETGNTIRCYEGPAFTFPDAIVHSAGVVLIEDERLLEHNFRGWVPSEIAAGRAPVLAVVEDGHPVSICFCARRTDVAAEAGVDTAEAYRGRGLAVRATAAWARAIRASGRIPLYSTSWTNEASLAVARKLKLVPYASNLESD
ncbi:MAG: GNAT family N-acetyltransferase [Longimicrobiales bacterium]